MALNDNVPSPEPVLAMIRGELSPGRRRFYGVMLVGISVWVAALASLWATEPGPLPLRLHVAFAAMMVIGVGWIGVLAWILVQRNCPTARDRVATGWMATAACVLFLAVSTPIALVRGDTMAALGLSVTGLALLAVAGAMLRSAYSLRARLRAKLAELRAVAPGDFAGLVLVAAVIGTVGAAVGSAWAWQIVS